MPVSCPCNAVVNARVPLQSLVFKELYSFITGSLCWMLPSCQQDGQGSGQEPMCESKLCFHMMDGGMGVYQLVNAS